MTKRTDTMFHDSLLGKGNDSPTSVIPPVHIVQFSGKCISEQAWDYNPESFVPREMKIFFI